MLLVGWEGDEPGPFATYDWEREGLGGTPTIHHRGSLSRSALREALLTEHAYVYYGNELTPEGFVCSDGVLRFDDVPEPNVGAVSAVWDRPDTAPVSGILRAATVGCLHERPLSRDAAERFAVYLATGATVSRSAVYAGIADRTRFVGDASLAAVVSPAGTPPFVFHVDRVADGYRVSIRAPPRVRGGLGSVAHVRPSQFSDAHRLTNNRTEAAVALSTEELVALGEYDGVFRFSCEPPASFPRAFVSRLDAESPLSDDLLRR